MSEQVSLVVTVLNEAQGIELLLSSILMQKRKPNEVIIVDGGSTDTTVAVIKDYLLLGNTHHPQKLTGGFLLEHLGITFKVFTKKGNRSIGRNFAIKKAAYDLIAITDAGCILDSRWLSELLKKAYKADVVAGYYNSDPIGPFEEAVVPYVLVMPDRVDPDTFLPATRSMLIRKDVFEELGGFNTSLSDNEDYALAQKMKSSKVKIVFARKAIVTWIPRSTLKQFFVMIMRFARGDIRAGILRPKVITIFLRYVIFITLALFIWPVSLGLFLIYLSWAILKNKKYVPHGWYYLPLLQVTSDAGVLWGSMQGLYTRLSHHGN